jgi:hypothetical protein
VASNKLTQAKADAIAAAQEAEPEITSRGRGNERQGSLGNLVTSGTITVEEAGYLRTGAARAAPVCGCRPPTGESSGIQRGAG